MWTAWKYLPTLKRIQSCQFTSLIFSVGCNDAHRYLTSKHLYFWSAGIGCLRKETTCHLSSESSTKEINMSLWQYASTRFNSLITEYFLAHQLLRTGKKNLQILPKCSSRDNRVCTVCHWLYRSHNKKQMHNLQTMISQLKRCMAVCANPHIMSVVIKRLS